MVMSMMAVTVVLMFMSGLNRTWNRIAESFNLLLQHFLRGLRSIIFHIHCLILKRDLKVLHTLFEGYVFLYLVYAVITMKMNYECDFLEVRFLSRARNGRHRECKKCHEGDGYDSFHICLYFIDDL